VKLVVGLGNPGREYVGTRHNVGFAVADRLAAEHTDGTWREAASALQARWRRGGPDDDVLIVKPLTFMNLSGQSVGEIVRFYKIDTSDLLIVSDDVNLPLGRLRARASGSEGGHNGLRSIAQHLGTIDYPRLRVGVGRGDGRRDLADHVLARFDAEEADAMAAAIARAADAADLWIREGLVKMMSSFNRWAGEGASDASEEARPDDHGH
jgi:PTH1 family peptidyl-tRNA hydrolase